VFYGLLALFPAVTALVSSYGLFAAAPTIRDHLSFAAEVMPADAYSIVQDQIARVVAKGDAKLSLGFVFGVGFALWSANAGMKAIIDALNVVYEEDEKRGFFRLNLISLTFTVGAIAALLVAVGAVVVTPLLLQRIGLGAQTESLVRIVRWPALMLGMLARPCGRGSASAPLPPHWRGLSAPPPCPTIWRITRIMTPPTVHWAPRSEP